LDLDGNLSGGPSIRHRKRDFASVLFQPADHLVPEFFKLIIEMEEGSQQ
jgi:hypothetical protein